MAKTVLEKVRKLNWVLQESISGAFSYTDICEILSDTMDSNIYVADIKGQIIGVAYKIEQDSAAVHDPETGGPIFPPDYNVELLKIEETVSNLRGDDALEIFKNNDDTVDKYHTIIPILGGGERLGTLIMTRYQPKFDDQDLILGEYGATVVGLEIRRREQLDKEEDERIKATVLKAMGTLSYSEVEAIQQIFHELGGDEGLLIASKIADRSGITRSVIVNALRKLESAGVIESRSLGMKGTHIKIINPKFIDELQKTGF